MVLKSIDYLRTKGQDANGAYSPAAGPGLTALVTTAILQHGRTPADPVVAKSLKYLESFVRQDRGGGRKDRAGIPASAYTAP